VPAQPAPRKASFAADSLAMGLVIMLLMTVVQRGLGFLRGIWFCRLLDDTAVGQWSMAFGFITMITPLMMLGLPGAMPRFVERYRLAGHLSVFLRRIIVGTLVGSGLVMTMMFFAPQQFGWLIFREPSSNALVWSVALTVLTVLVFNFVNELVSSLRQVRVVSLMQFLQGVGFTVFGIGAIYAGGGLREIILSFAVATVIATIPGLWTLLRNWAGLECNDANFDASQMWRSLLPYAAALWVMNLLTNAFEMSDRYMILHLIPGGEETAKAAVGQYHSGRLIPTLLTSLATMFGGVLLPYLSADWEQGKSEAVQQRLGRVLFAMSAGFTACAAVTMLISPWLFRTLLQGRYSEGLAIQPMAFTFCIWAAVVTVAQSYLWVRERGSLVGWSLAVGLIVNVALNHWWLPKWGLSGAVAATLVSNALVLLCIWWALAHVGYRLDSGMVWISLLPLTLLAGWSVSLVAAIGSLVMHQETRLYIHERLADLPSHFPQLARWGFVAQKPSDPCSVVCKRLCDHGVRRCKGTVLTPAGR
jgi:polysaccharide transporter, PST family